MSDNNFDKILKEKIEDYSMPVSDETWNKIEKSLDAKPHRINRWLWMPEIAVAASILLCLFLIPDKGNTGYKQTASNLLPTSKQIETEKQQPLDTYIQDDDKEIVTQVSQDKIVHKKTKENPVETLVAYVETSDFHKEMVQENAIAPNEAPKEPEEKPSNQQPVKKTIASENLLDNNLLSENDGDKPKKQKSMGLFFGSMDNTLAMNDNGGDSYAIPSNSFSDPRALLASKMSLLDAFKTQNILEQEQFPDATHHAPVSMGISFKKELNQIFALESGLVYTFISSEFENKNINRNAKLQLHYVGIPLNLHTRIYGNRNSNWGIYFSTGGMVEKGVLSHYVQKERVSDDYITMVNSNEKIDGLQWSLSASPGVNYKLSKNYSLYFEPKISYYFDNKQPISVRTEHPIVIGLNAGVRFNW
jgi:hypothetical protein